MKYSIDTKKYIDRMVRFCKAQGVNINLENPTTIQDKLAWLNIYDENPLKTKCADKIKLHEYCKEKLGKDICVPILHVYDKVEDINWDELPEQFVMKCNHGSGMNIIVKNKKELDIEKAKKDLTLWMNDDFSIRNGFEAHYHDIERKIFVEKYMEVNGDIPYDYKFLCFNGKPKLVQVFGERFNANRHMNYYDMDFNYVDLVRTDFKNIPNANHKKPKNFKEMKEFARTLSEDFKFVRADFYEINGKVYLGELTFTPGAMAFKYENDDDNKRVGDLLELLNVDVYCLCKNEIKLAPFFIDYWKALGNVNVYIYDGDSDDGTRELFSKYDFIHIIDFEKDALNDLEHKKLKDKCWKGSKADFVMVCDFDETIVSYSKEELTSSLLHMKANGYSVLVPLSFSLIPDTFPEYIEGKYMHELCEYGFNDYIWEAKPILFDPHKIKEIDFDLGGHCAHPKGEVNWYKARNLFLIHAKFVGFDYYIERIRNRIISDWNLKYNLDGETKKTLEQMENTFNENKKKRFKWKDIKDNFNEYYHDRLDWSRWGGMKLTLNEKIAIYTGIIGFYDTPYDNFEHKEGYDYILFSDRKIDTNSWDNRVVNFENADKLDGIKKSRFIKTHPDSLLNGYDIVVWVDCNTVIDEKIYKYINEVKDALITFKKHPDRDCIYDEIMACSYVKKESYEKCLKIYDKYARDGYPRHYGLYENNIIVSHYNDPRVKALMSKWWDEIYNNSHRDQLSLNYVIWKNGYAPMITVAETNYFPPRPHSRPKVSTSNIGKKGKKKKKES